MSSSLQEKYIKEVIPAMRAEFGYTSVMAVPRVEKVTINVGVGKIKDEKQMQEIARVLALVTGQKASPRPAKKAIASFKTRKGQIIGYSVTLRGKRMFDFLGRFVGVALPRGRDFRGISEKSFDRAGNLTIGIREHIVFPEMLNEDVKFIFGMEITVTTTAKKKEEGISLLKRMGFPIKTTNNQ